MPECDRTRLKGLRPGSPASCTQAKVDGVLAFILAVLGLKKRKIAFGLRKLTLGAMKRRIARWWTASRRWWEKNPEAPLESASCSSALMTRNGTECATDKPMSLPICSTDAQGNACGQWLGDDHKNASARTVNLFFFLKKKNTESLAILKDCAMLPSGTKGHTPDTTHRRPLHWLVFLATCSSGVPGCDRDLWPHRPRT